MFVLNTWKRLRNYEKCQILKFEGDCMSYKENAVFTKNSEKTNCLYS